MATEKCSLCGFDIPQNEGAYLLNDEVVCVQCYRINTSPKAPQKEQSTTPASGLTTKIHHVLSIKGISTGHASKLHDPSRDTRILNIYCTILRAIGYVFCGIGLVGGIVIVIVGIALSIRGRVAQPMEVALLIGPGAFLCGILIMYLFLLNAAFIAAISSVAHNVHAMARNKEGNA